MLLSLLSNVLPTLVVSSRGREQNCDRVTRRFARLEEISVEFIQLAPSPPLPFLPNRDPHATRCPRRRTSPLRFTRWRGSRGIASFFSSFFLQRILVKGFFFLLLKKKKKEKRGGSFVDCSTFVLSASFFLFLFFSLDTLAREVAEASRRRHQTQRRKADR